MATSTAIWRSLQGFVVLLISAVLLLLTLDFGSEVSQTTLTDRRADLEVVPTKQGSTSVPKSIALPFGRQHHAVNFSSPLDHHSLFERADPPSNYAALVCKGGIFLESIKAAFEGSTPGISFPESELENGWTKTTEVEEEDLEAIERRWKGTFDALFGAYPPQSDIKPVILIQNKEYDTILDDHVDVRHRNRNPRPIAWLLIIPAETHPSPIPRPLLSEPATRHVCGLLQRSSAHPGSQQEGKAPVQIREGRITPDNLEAFRSDLAGLDHRGFESRTTSLSCS